MMFSVNLESVTFMKVKIIVYQGRSYTISLQRGMSKLYLETNRKYNYTNYMQVILMRLMSKIENHIMPKGTKFTGLGKLGLRLQHVSKKRYTIIELHLSKCTLDATP